MERALALAVIAANAVALYLRNDAHTSLGVGLSPWQKGFVYTVIVPAPLVAGALVWGSRPVGYALLLVSLLGSLLFGVYHHFIAISSDHVDHLPAGDAQGLFRSTAWITAVLELAGVAIAGWALARGHDRTREPQA